MTAGKAWQARGPPVVLAFTRRLFLSSRFMEIDMTDLPQTFDDLPEFLRRIADNVASAIIAAGRTPAEAAEPARAVRKLFDQPGDVLSAYSREMADHAASLMEAEILRRVAVSHEERSSPITITLENMPGNFRAGVEKFATDIIAAGMTGEEAAAAARQARGIVEQAFRGGGENHVHLRAIAATIIPPDETRIDTGTLSELTADVLSRVGEMVENEILRRVAAATGSADGGRC